MTDEDEEFNRIERESRVKQEYVRSIKEALAKPEQEPVGVVCMDISNAHMVYGTQYLGQQPDKKTAMLFKDLEVGTKLYTTPPQRTWVGLDPEEIRKTNHHMVDGAYHYSFKQGAEWAEAKLKEKNT